MMASFSKANKCAIYLTETEIHHLDRQAGRRGKHVIVNAAFFTYRLRYKCSRTSRESISWQLVDKLVHNFLKLLSVSCVMCFLIHALVNLEAPGFYPSPYFLQTYGQLGDDIDGRGWEEKKNSQMLSGNAAPRSIKTQFYGLAWILGNVIE